MLFSCWHGESRVCRLEVKFDPDKIGNFVTGFAKVGVVVAVYRIAACIKLLP